MNLENDLRRIMSVEVDLTFMKQKVYNELWSIKEEKCIKKFDFSLQIYTYQQIIKNTEQYGFKLRTIRGRFNEKRIYANEPQVIFIFEKQ